MELKFLGHWAISITLHSLDSFFRTPAVAEPTLNSQPVPEPKPVPGAETQLTAQAPDYHS